MNRQHIITDLSAYERLLVIADIHGNERALKKILARLERGEADHILIAGDLGVRHRDAAAAELRRHRNHITAVKGNCDTRQDAEITGLPLPASQTISWNSSTILLMHGHQLRATGQPLMKPHAILITGHTHTPRIHYDAARDTLQLNPGSISAPCSGYPPTYAIITPLAAAIHHLASGKLLFNHNR